MNVRGAPLIAIVAVLGMGVDISGQAGGFKSAGQAQAWVAQAADYLRTSRPTAVNLFTAMDEVVALAGKVRGEGGGEGPCGWVGGSWGPLFVSAMQGGWAGYCVRACVCACLHPSSHAWV